MPEAQGSEMVTLGARLLEHAEKTEKVLEEVSKLRERAPILEKELRLLQRAVLAPESFGEGEEDPRDFAGQLLTLSVVAFVGISTIWITIKDGH